jgi:hypothetical protein
MSGQYCVPVYRVYRVNIQAENVVIDQFCEIGSRGPVRDQEDNPSAHLTGLCGQYGGSIRYVSA